MTDAAKSEQKDRTEGERRVRKSFNPNGNPDVEKVKQLSAALIDLVREHPAAATDPRLAALAMTAYEEAAMWAVKLVTT
jgi:hypothetical protein